MKVCFFLSVFSLSALVLTSCSQDQESKSATTASVSEKRYYMQSLSIQLPIGWQEVSNADKSLHIFKNSQCDTSLAFCENLSVNFRPNTANLSLKQVENSILASLPVRYNKFRLISSRDTIIHTMPAKVIDYMVNEQATDLGATMGVVIKNDTVVVITGMALNQPKGTYIKYRRPIMGIINSLSNK